MERYDHQEQEQMGNESKKCSIFRRQKLKHICTLKVLLYTKSEVAVRHTVASSSGCIEISVVTIFFYYLIEWI